jgi:pimeloyl-ACP methyl ester carboxylesterase
VHLCCVVAENGNTKQPIGFGLLNTNTSVIKALYVHNTYFKLGIGSKIIKYLEQETLNKKNMTIYLRASLNALNFYNKNGFQEICPTKCFIKTNLNLDGIFMAKNLMPHSNCALIKSSKTFIWTETFNIKDNESCLFISGAGASLKFWNDRFCKYFLDNKYGVIRYDLRDQGLSSKVDYSKEPYSLFDLAQDAISIIDHYGILKVHVIGHSMGGKIAQILALLYPKRVLSFTSISASLIDNPFYPSKELMTKLLKNKPSGNFTQDLIGFMRSWEMLNGSLTLNHNIASSYTEDLYDRSLHMVGVALNHIKCQKQPDLIMQKIHKIKSPGFFISGAKDPMVPTEDVIKNSAIIQNSQVTIIPQMGHMIFNQTIEKKLATIIIKNLKSLKI